jgi:hypothetical protein
VDEVRLAWELAAIAGGHLDAVEHNEVYVAIGAGDTFVAIGMLMRKLAAAELAVGSDLAARLSGWLVSYSDHPDVRHLCGLIDRLSIVEARPGYAPVAPFRSLSVASRYARRNAT